MTYRRVTCGFTGNVIVQQGTDSNLFFMRAQIAHHNTPLKATITVQESGKAATVVTRTSFGFWDWNPNNAVFPITITIEDIFGSTITAVWPTHSPGQIVDTGRQFPEPPAGTGGAESNCPGGVCPAPLINNGQLVIFEDSTFPQRTPDWLPLTQHAWMWFSGSLTPIASPVFSGTMAGSTTLGSFGEIHIGCNVQSPKSDIAFVTLAIRMPSGVTSPGLQWWSDTGAHVAMTPTPTSAQWTQYWLPIAGNPNVPGTVFADLQIQHMGNTATQYLVDNFYFVLSNSALATPCQPFNFPQPSQPVGLTTVAVTTTTGATTTPAVTTAATVPVTTAATVPVTTAATVPVTTVAATTTGAGGSTAAPTTASPTTTTTTRATTTRATTTGPGGSTAAPGPTTTGPACVPATPAPVRVPCAIACCPPTPGRTVLVFTLVTNYDDFNCPSFQGEAVGALRSSTLKICGHRRGSSIIDVEVTSAEADALFASGALPAPVTDFVSAVDPASGRSVAVPSTFPLWIIAIIVLAVLLIAAAIVLFVCWWRRKKGSHRHSYAAVPSTEYRAFPTSASVPAASAAAAPAPAGLACMQLMHDVVDVADGVLNGKRGDICYVEHNDLAAPADWVWVRIGAQNGYVPKNYLQPK